MAGAESADRHAEIREVAARLREKGECAARSARDPANLPMIHNWVQAVGDGNPVYTDERAARASVHGGLVAPPAMAQVWTMDGGRDPEQDPLGAMSRILDDAGYTSVVATNCDQIYHRYLRHGEHVAVTAALEELVGPKTTALGEGWFVTTRSTWYVGAEPVAEMRFRILKFRPAAQGASGGSAEETGERTGDEAGGEPGEKAGAKPGEKAADEPAGEPIRPAISRDTAYFWEGARVGELRIQRCGRCGLLRHPPGPMCPECGATKPTYLVSRGVGEVHSYTVHHHPPLPGKQLPLVVALVELDEGVRVLGELPGVDPGRVRIGMEVEVGFHEIDEGLALPHWKPRTGGRT